MSPIRRHRRALRRRLGEHLAVVLRGGDVTIQGWLEDIHADGYELSGARLLHDGADEPVPLVGSVFVADSEILFVQLGVSR